MYGLKQSGKSWNTKLNNVLKNMDLTRSRADPCIYYCRTQRKIVIVAVYVDDMFILSNDTQLLQATKKKLSNKFKMKDLGEARSLLGMRITRDRQRGKIWLDQEAYVEDILKRFNMAECKPISTPLDTNQKLSREMEPQEQKEIDDMRKIPYKEAVGSLMHASQGTRPDLTYAVGLVSRFCQNPGKIHWSAVKRIFRYLKGTLAAKLEFSKTGNGNLEGYSDAGWANDNTDRRSVTGYAFTLQGAPISWQSRKQKTVALSTTEAEYMALSAAIQEALWLRKLAKELDPETVTKAMLIRCDNKGSIDLAKNSGYHQRTKHIDIRHNFVREHVEGGEIQLLYTPTEEMIADALTKAVPSPKLKFCTEAMGLRAN